MSAAALRFLGLPREIRNKVYRAALCSFEPPPTTFVPPPDADTNPDVMSRAHVAKHAIDTSVLLVPKQIHWEAYDAMVKTNRFVRVTTSWGIPIRTLLNHLCVPVVTASKECVDYFRAMYFLSPSHVRKRRSEMSSKKVRFSLDPSSFMLPGRDMASFCDALMGGNIYISDVKSKVSLKIAVAPGSILLPSPYIDSPSVGFEKTKLRVLVSHTIAENAGSDISHDVASDPAATLMKYRRAKEQGQSYFRERQSEAACLAWQDATLEIEHLHESGFWKKLTGKDGDSFVSHRADLCFLVRLNTAHIKIGAMQRGEPFANVAVQDALSMAMQSIKGNHCMPGLRYRPTEASRAKLAYRHAMFLRLQGSPRNVDVAAATIEVAHQLVPNDAVIARERDTILEWKASMI